MNINCCTEEKEMRTDCFLIKRNFRAKNKGKIRFYERHFEPSPKDWFNVRLTKQNFKHTNAAKLSYSCGGYGGRCSMCKLHERDTKQKEIFSIKRMFEY